MRHKDEPSSPLMTSSLFSVLLSFSRTIRYSFTSGEEAGEGRREEGKKRKGNQKKKRGEGKREREGRGEKEKGGRGGRE